MKLKACLLVVLTFFGCSGPSEEQSELEEIVQNESVGIIELR